MLLECITPGDAGQNLEPHIVTAGAGQFMLKIYPQFMIVYWGGNLWLLFFPLRTEVIGVL